MGYDYAYQYEYPAVNYSSGISDSLLSALLSIYLIVLTLILIFTLVSYIFHSVGLYTIGKRMGKAHPWLAFIPFARDYFHGELAGEIRLKDRSVKNPGIWNLVLPIAFSVVSGAVLGLLILAAVLGMAGGGVGIGIMMLIMMYVFLVLLTVAYSAVYMTLRILINIQIYERFTTHNMGIVHAVLSAAVPLYEAVCLFVMRNREFMPGREPRMTPPPAPPVYPLPPVPPVSPVPSASPEAGPAEKPVSAEGPVSPQAEPASPEATEETGAEQKTNDIV